MSTWKFILIDRNGLRTEVPEPIDWVDPEVVVARDHDNGWHGVFFDYGINKLTFNDTGAELIKTEYEEYGVNGEMRVDILFQCSEDNRYDTFYENGRIAFDQYSDTCGDECTVSVGIEDSSDIMLFKNNYEQSVNLNSNIAFDQETVLTDYEWLNKDIEIPGRGLPQVSDGFNNDTQSIQLLDFIGWGTIQQNGQTGTEQGALMPMFASSNLTEIANTAINSSAYYNSDVRFNDGEDSEGTPPFLDIVRNSQLQCFPTLLDFRYTVKGRLIDQSNATRIVDMNLIVRIGEDAANTTLFSNQILVSYEAGTFQTTEFNVSANTTISIQPGEKAYVFILITYQKLSSAAIQSLIVEFDEETEIYFAGISNCEASDAKSYMINEAVSRTVEAITNDNIRFYSSTFGRIDSQPYSINFDPCPGLFSITQGLNIRRKLLIDNSQPGFFTNMKKLFSGLNGIWNIGLTIEPDPNRAGYNRLRFEDWRFFYQDEVSIRFLYPTKITRSIDLSRVYNSMKVGYNKWEAEGTTGLYELMTTRNYRININSIKNELDITTDIICSPYTTEITRRLNSTSNDWKYDNDTFGFCLGRTGADFFVKTFLYNATNITNVSDPNTAYNDIVTPARNAMRWFNYIMQGLRNLKPDSKLIFSNGTGNYIASLQTTSCNIEGKTLAENEDLDVTDFEDIEDAYPITYPETVTFEHPMNYNTFKRIKDDPTVRRKSVSYTCNGTEFEGWIDKISYRPIAGMATVTLIPKNDSLAQLPDPSCGATVSNLTFNSTEDNQMSVDWTEGVAGANYWQLLIFKDGDNYLTANYSTHPVNLTGLPVGNYHVYVVPYCENGLPGANYVDDQFEIALPDFAIELSAVLTTGRNPNNKLQLTATGNTAAISGFSFKFGQCTFNSSIGIEYCLSYPGSLSPPPSSPAGVMSFNTGDTNKMVESGSSTPGADFGYITKVVLFDLVGITPAQITKAVGQTWTLVFL